MKRTWLILVGGLAAAGAVFAVVYFSVPAPEPVRHSNLEWMKQEYHLSDAQFVRVIELHKAYWPKCGEMCGRIDDKNGKLQELLAATNVVTPEIKAALAEVAQVRIECQTAMLQHFYDVSQVMPPDQARRYLAWVHEETLLPHQMVPTTRTTKEH